MPPKHRAAERQSPNATYAIDAAASIPAAAKQIVIRVRILMAIFYIA